jgi:DNA-binding transcriptional LysR family regulator
MGCAVPPGTFETVAQPSWARGSRRSMAIAGRAQYRIKRSNLGRSSAFTTRKLTIEHLKTLASVCLYTDPLIAVLPCSRLMKTKRVRVSDLAADSFVLFHREGSSTLFDTITSVCNDAGFSPRVENEPNMMQTVLSLVEAEQGVSIVPACVRNLRRDGVRFYRLQPDKVTVELVAVWKKDRPSVVLRGFLDLLNTNASRIRKKASVSWV